MAKKTKRQKIRKAVIPVAGFGTRFLPATIAQPKEMLPIVDKPVIQYIVEEMAKAGIEEIIFVTGRNKRAIEDHFDYSAELELSLRESKKLKQLKEVHRISKLAKFVYVRQNKILGNANALYMAKEIVGNEPFAFSFGDDIIESRQPAIGQLIETYNRTGASVIGTMEVAREMVRHYGMMRPKGKTVQQAFPVAGVIEKPDPAKTPSLFAVTGRYVLTPDIFDWIERLPAGTGGELQLSDAVNNMARRKAVYARIIKGRYFDCGSKREYLKANIHFALKHPELKQDIKDYLDR